MESVLLFSYLQNISTEITAVSKRDISYMSTKVDVLPHNESHWGINMDENIATLSVFEKQKVLHRVARQVRQPGKGAGPVVGEGQVYDTSSTDAEFLSYYWAHPFLLANAFFGVSAVIALLRMLPYVVVSDVVGPLQISLGSMVTQTAHFFLVVAVVLFSFAVGLTYIYSYYEETTLLTCNDAGEACQRGYFGK